MWRLLLIGTLFLANCRSVEPGTGREVKKDTRDKRKLSILLTASSKEDNQEHLFNLREQNFFDYSTKASGLSKTELYAGTYSRRGDSVFLAFFNNYKPGDLTGIGIIHEAAHEFLLLGKTSTYRMTVTANR
ncbi:MAG TPA: hypothetical protein VHK91_02645 [Flavisolibacter sp.]|jgi:hypothetical protein|nr:hypothetical protein [Flavisolibacter sp.]